MLTLGTSLVVQRLLFSNTGGEGLSLVREISSYNVKQPKNFLEKDYRKVFCFCFLIYIVVWLIFMGFPGGSVVKNLPPI